MSKKLGFKTEKKKFISGLFLRVFAEEPEKDDEPKKDEPKKEETKPKEEEGNSTPDTKNEEGSHSQINYEDLITRARKEEKEKLYPKIKTLEAENKKLVEKNNANLITIEEKEREISSLKEQLENKGGSESEKVRALNKEIKNLEKEIKDLKEAQADVEEIENKIKAQYEVKVYRLEKVHEAGSSIIPELVTGTTKEEIDASLEIAKQRYAQIQENVLKTSGAKKIPSTNVDMSAFDVKDVSIEDISKMDVGSPEYKEMRRKLGLR